MPAKKRPKGRPQFTKPKQTEFLEYLRSGMRRGAAAKLLGLDRRFVLDYIATHEDYEARVARAESEAVEEALYHQAVSGSVAAAKLWLELRKPQSTEDAELDALLAEMTSG